MTHRGPFQPRTFCDSVKLIFWPSLRYHRKTLDLKEVNNELILRRWHSVRQVQPRLSGFFSVTSVSSPHEGHLLACQKVLLLVGEVSLMAAEWCSGSLRFTGLGSASGGDTRKTQTWRVCLVFPSREVGGLKGARRVPSLRAGASATASSCRWGTAGRACAPADPDRSVWGWRKGKEWGFLKRRLLIG